MEETAKKESEEKKLKEKEQEKAPKLPAVPATQGLHGALQPKDMILNTKLPDSGSKSFFDNQILHPITESHGGRAENKKTFPGISIDITAY